jgi:multidrug efflux pump subunit AcrB/outer membrane protein TolC
MRNWFRAQKRAILVLGLLLTIGGLWAWQQMPKQEDPRFPNRFGAISVIFPGADAERMERLVVLPLERELNEIAEVTTVSSTSRNDAAVATVALEESVYETGPVWDKVEKAVEDAKGKFPSGVTSVRTDWNTTDLEAITYAITGTHSWDRLLAAADRVEEQLLRVEGVKRVVKTPDLDMQVTVALEQAVSGAVGLPPAQVSAILEGRSRIIPGGTSRLGSREVAIDGGNSYGSLAEIRRTAVPVGGQMIPLESVAEVRYGAEEPVRQRVRFNGERAVVVGIVPEQDTDMIDFGQRIRAHEDALRTAVKPLAFHELTFQPDHVESRLNGLRLALLQGILIVAAIVIVAMGFRVGGIVALSVPAVAFTSVLAYYIAGGVLHQIAVAALVVTLGLIVDNAVVVAERIQGRIDAGEPQDSATRTSVRELVLPLAAATGTTMAAFIPLLLSKGVSADFTRAIPQVVMLGIGVSFLFSMTVIPTLGASVFRRQPGHSGARSSFAYAVAGYVTRRPVSVLFGAAALLGSALVLVPQIQLQFFPSADRNQVVLELELPAGAHVEETSEAAQNLEKELIEMEQVQHLASFVGRSTPPFYYNLTGKTNSPNFAQLLVTTKSEEAISAVTDRARSLAERSLPGTTFVVRELEQGPPASAPVAFRLYSDDRQALAQGVRDLATAVRNTEGTKEVRHDLDLGSLAYRIRTDEATARARGTSVTGVARALLGRTRGIPAGEYRGSDEPARIVVRSPRGEDTPLGELETTLVGTANGVRQQRGGRNSGQQLLPLSAVAIGELEIRPAAIRRENGRQIATVFSELQEGYGFNTVLEEIQPRLDALLPEEVSYELGGAAESSQEANSAIAGASYLGVGILLFILLLQFRSFIRVGLVLLTVPLAAVGVIPGLVLFNEPFGFTSLLGTLSLVGIVVNNAIILLDTIEAKRRQDIPIAEAVSSAVSERIRPILLTVITTVCGLMPLLFSDSSLWPPFASALISGLLASTVMTLLVIPAAYYLIFRRKAASGSDDGGGRIGARVTAPSPPVALFALATLFALASPTGLEAQSDGQLADRKADLASATAEGFDHISLMEALESTAENPSVRAARVQARAEARALAAARREAWLPALSVEGRYLRRNEEVSTSFGPMIGDVTQLSEEEREVVVSIEQPLFNLDGWDGALASQSAALEAQRARAAETTSRERLATVGSYIQVRRLEARLAGARESRKALSSQLDRVKRLVEAGRLLRSDRLRLEVEVRSVQQQIAELEGALAVARRDLARRAGRDRSVGAAPLELRKDALRRWLSQLPSDVRSRPQVDALAGSIDRLEAERRALLQGGAPELRLRLSGVRQFETALEPERWLEGELTLSWTPIARGVRAARRSELAERKEALRQRYVNALAAGKVQVARVKNDIMAALQRTSVKEQNVEQMQQLLDETRKLYQAGRVPLSDFVAAEARLQQARVDRALARLDAVEAAARLTQITGKQLQSEMPLWVEVE